MFQFIKNSLKAIYNRFTSGISALFSKSTVDEQTLLQLEELLITSDVGVATTRTIVARLKQELANAPLQGDQALKLLQQILNEILSKTPRTDPFKQEIFLLVGINGSGKTTFAGKLVTLLKKQGRTPLLVAADTFRAAAIDQLRQWAEKTNTPFLDGQGVCDPSAVVFKGCQEFLNGNHQTMIIDTAGRLQNKSHLLDELAKMRRVITKQLPNARVCTLVTIDALLGQNSLEQARMFQECTQLDGVVLTKMDSSSKGGIIFAIAHELRIPIIFLSFGESEQDIALFDYKKYVSELLSLDEYA